MGYYLKWTPQEVYYYAVENTNFKARPFRTQGTYSKYNSIDDKIDDLHKTLPYLTKYEKTRVIGQRAKQINSGAYPFVKVPENVIDGYIIAEIELKEKRIPFIIRRPMPNGGSEYWKIKDLEDISF